MPLGRTFGGLAVLLAAVVVAAAGVGLTGLLATPAALATGVVCLLAVVGLVAAGAIGAGPRTPYW